MYDKLIERLRASCESCKLWDGYKCCLKGECSAQKSLQAADAIEELQTVVDGLTAQTNMVFEKTEGRTVIKFEPKWIPVTERLPEIDMSYPHHEDYLVQYDSGNMDVASWSNVNRFWTDHVTEPHWNCVQFAKVIAWMPLPQPPESEE